MEVLRERRLRRETEKQERERERERKGEEDWFIHYDKRNQDESVFFKDRATDKLEWRES